MNKKILFILGDIPKNVSNGQILYQYLIIKHMAKIHDCYVVGHYQDKTFLDDITKLDNNNIYKLYKNDKLLAGLKSIVTFTPYISQKYNNKKNIQVINKIIKDNDIDICHSIYFPSTCILASQIKIQNSIMTMPDLYSKFYKQLLIKNKTNFKFLYNFLSYKLLEYRLKYVFNSVQFVNYSEVSESQFNNAKYIPLLFNKLIEFDLSKKIKKILLPRANVENTIWFLTNVIDKLPEYDFVVISSDVIVKNHIKNSQSKNVELVTWVDNYDTYINQFYLHVVIDYIGTGLSTKIIHSFMNGNLTIGTDLSYRGLPDLPNNLKVVFNDTMQLVSLIKNYMTMDKNEYMNIINSAKEYANRTFSNDKTLDLIESTYIIYDGEK